MTHATVGVLFLSSLLGVASSAFAGDDFVKSRDIFRYQGAGYSCEMTPDGIVHNCRNDRTIFIKNAGIHGIHAGTNLFYQTDDGLPIEIRDDGGNNFTVVKKGFLENRNHPGAAAYTQTIKLNPGGMDFEYEITTRIELASNYHLFQTLLYLPAEIYGGKGFKLVPIRNIEKLGVFQREFRKETTLHSVDIRDIKISLDACLIEFSGGDNTAMSIKDTRAWGETSFRLDVSPAGPWKSKLEIFPVGTVFKWSFNVSFTAHNN